MSGVVVKTVEGGEKRTIVLKRVLTKLEHCDKTSAFAGLIEVDRVKKMSDEEFFSEFNANNNIYMSIYIRNILKFISPCHTTMSMQHLKEMVQKVPKKLSGWIGMGIKIVYNSKKERGVGIEIRYKDGDVEFWKIQEDSK
jgi:hypothetical protein